MRRLLRCSLGIALAGCATGAACATERTLGDQSFAPARVQLIARDEALAKKLEGESFEIAFGDGENGTALLFTFFDTIERHGDTRVSDLEIETTTVHRGVLRRCAARI